MEENPFVVDSIKKYPLLGFLALNRNTVLLLIALVVGGTGERLWIGFAPKYLESLGAGILAIGLFDALQTLLGAIYTYPGGWITDRWGHRRALLLFSTLAIAGYVLIFLWQHWVGLLLGAFLFLAWSALSLPATFTVIATSLEANRHAMGVGVQSLVRRLPMMIGPLTGGWLVTHYGWAGGIRLAFALCIILGIATLPLQWFLADAPSRPAASNPHADPGFVAVVKRFSPSLRELLISDVLIRFCERIPYAFVIFWVMDHAGVSAQRFGVLVAIETGTAMLCYIPVAHLADKHGRRPFILATFVFFTLFPLTLLFCHSFAWLTLAFTIRGLKEFGEPSRKAFIIGEASSELRARTYGAYYLIRDCIVTSGSLFGAWIWSISPKLNLVAATLCGLAGTLWFWRTFYSLKKNPAPR